MIFNERFENDVNEVKKAIDLFSKTDDCGIREFKKEREVLKHLEHFLDKCAEVDKKYPDEIKIGKYFTAQLVYHYHSHELYVSVDLDNKLESELYSRYYSSYSGIHTYTESVFFKLIEHLIDWGKINLEARFGDIKMDQWYMREEITSKIDAAVGGVEYLMKELTALSKDEKFTNMLDSITETYTSYLLSFGGD